MKKLAALVLSAIVFTSVYGQNVSAASNIPETNLNGISVLDTITYGNGVTEKLPDKPIMLYINGSIYNANIIIENDRTLVPLRFISENLGAQVAWDNATRKVTISDGSNKIELVIGNNKPTLNGKVIQIDAAPKIFNDYTYVPLRFIAEALNCKVDWYDESGVSTDTSGYALPTSTETHYPIGIRQVMVSRYPSGAKALTETEVIKILEDQLKIAYKTRFGVEFSPLATMPDSRDEQETFRYSISHLSAKFTNDRFYNFIFNWIFMVDKYTGTVYLYYGGAPATINVFNPHGPGGYIGFAG